MPNFDYEALDPAGRRIEGVEEAESQALLVSQLADRGLQPIRIKKARSLNALLSGPKKRLSQDDLLYFTRELADLLEAGVPLERSLAIVADAAEQEGLRDLLNSVRKEIQGGMNLSDALSPHSRIFSRLYINMIRVGELGGVLPSVLKKLDGFMERSRQIRKFIVTSSIYPVILMLVGIVSVFVLVTFVVPKFGQIFKDLDQPVPAVTMVVIAASSFLHNWWWLIALILLAVFGGSWWYLKTPDGRAWWDSTVLRLPMAGPMYYRIELGRFSRTLGTLIESGVPILKGISLASEVIGNGVIRSAVDELYKGVRQGQSLSHLMKKGGIFPSLMVHLVAIGEETGAMGTMLLKIADDFEEKVQHDTKVYLSLVEPITIVVMGLIIGGIILSMLLAIFGINDISF